MPFTDEDLRIVKGELQNWYTTLTTTGGMQALIARLEAAEAYAARMAVKFPSYFLKEFYAWRESGR